MGNLKLVERSSETIVTLDEIKQHVRRLDTSDDDEIIMRYLRAAQQYVENWTGLSFFNQTYDYFLDEFPATISNVNQSIALPRSPLIEVLSVNYFDSNLAEFQFADFLVDEAARPGRIYTTSSWPGTSINSQNAVRIRFRAGFMDSEGSPNQSEAYIPEDLKVAVMIYAQTLYENREAVVTGTIVSKMPWSAEEIMRQYRVENSLA